MKNNAMIIILSAPSGCGKSSIAQKLLETDSNLVLSISATTRPARIGEIDGVHYFFKTREEFKNLDLLESAEIYGNLYGTPIEFVERKLAEGRDVLFDIDSQGAYQVKQIVKNRPFSKFVSIFILPPSIEALRKRMLKRGQDSKDVIEQRLKVAKSEIDEAKNYDYVVMNDNFGQAVKEIRTIILSHRSGKKYDPK